MRVLHLAVHLGGGIGKAHAAMAPYMPEDIEQTFVLLQEPIDDRHVDAICGSGGEVVVTASKKRIVALAEGSDILQIEFWGHPALAELLDGWNWPSDLPVVSWCHVSGLYPPEIPVRLLNESRLVVTSPITLAALPPQRRRWVEVINSGFGFEGASSRQHEKVGVTYLGTVDFKKLHQDFFSAIDAAKPLPRRVGPIMVYGHVSHEAAMAWMSMEDPTSVLLCGHTLDPKAALLDSGIFFYPLQAKHYGTAENALIEAMSLGVVPVVLDNPAESLIVEDGESGLVASTVEEAIEGVRILVRSPAFRRDLSMGAMKAARRYSPHTSARQFVDMWSRLLMPRSQRAYA